MTHEQRWYLLSHIASGVAGGLMTGVSLSNERDRQQVAEYAVDVAKRTLQLILLHEPRIACPVTGCMLNIGHRGHCSDYDGRQIGVSP